MLRPIYSFIKGQAPYYKHRGLLGNLVVGAKPFKPNPAVMERITKAYERAEKSPISGMWEPLVAKMRADQLPNFFREDCSDGIVSHETFRGVRSGWKGRRFIGVLLGDIKLFQDMTKLPIYSLSSLKIGNPWGYWHKDILVLPDAPRHAYYAWRTRNLLDRGLVAEIGGGYGGFAYFLMQTPGFRYINIDLPEVLMISSYYLMHAYPEKKFLLWGEKGKLSDADFVLMPPEAVWMIPDRSVDLFLNSNSLSEMPREVCYDYIGHINRATKRYFFHVNSDEPNDLENAASQFPVSDDFRLIHRYPCGFGGYGNRYREFLYERR